MPGKKKKFIQKDKIIQQYKYVSRSQRDPLTLTGEASEHVLVEVNPTSRFDEQKKYGINFEDDYDYMQHLKDVGELNHVEPADQLRFSVKPPVPTDGAAAAAEHKLQLPSCVFGSTIETKVGLLNRAIPLRGPQLDWDPDIVAALDDDFDFDNEKNVMEDDFIQRLVAKGPHDQDMDDDDGPYVDGEDERDIWEDDEEGADGDSMDEDGNHQHDNQVNDKGHANSTDLHSSLASSPPHTVHSRTDRDVVPEEDESESDVDSYPDEEDDDIGSLGEHTFADEETKSKFTQYSMSSSIKERNEGLKLVDETFEVAFDGYSAENIGALDHEEIQGCIRPDSERMQQILREYEEQQAQLNVKNLVPEKFLRARDDDESSSEDDLVKMVIEKPNRQWDCESILSTHSTLFNHPTVIKEPKKMVPKPIKLTKRVEIPADVLPERGPTQRQMEREENMANKPDAALFTRTKDETADERQARKQAVKEAQRTRRLEKRCNKLAFKEEKLRQHQETVNLQKNLNGIHLD